MATQDSTQSDGFDKLSAKQFLAIADAARFQARRGKTRRALNALINPKPWRERYREYIDSPKWHRFRDRILRDRGKACERCGVATHKLHVHHLSYARFGAELPDDVIVVCVPCHQKRHMDKKTFWG